MSRRRFIQTTGGVVVSGAALGPSFLQAQSMHRHDDDHDQDPLPIPGGSPALGGGFHVYGPTPDGSFDPIDAEPATITNFHGDVGLAYISGMVTRTRMSTGARARLPFLSSDMRFMQGVYRGMDGKPREGTFALI